MGGGCSSARAPRSPGRRFSRRGGWSDQRTMPGDEWHPPASIRNVRSSSRRIPRSAVSVPAGRHVIVLTYDDPTIGYGMLGSAAALIVLLGGAWLMRRRERGGEAEVNPPGGREREPSAGSDSDGG